MAGGREEKSGLSVMSPRLQTLFPKPVGIYLKYTPRAMKSKQNTHIFYETWTKYIRIGKWRKRPIPPAAHKIGQNARSQIENDGSQMRPPFPRGLQRLWARSARRGARRKRRGRKHLFGMVQKSWSVRLRRTGRQQLMFHGAPLGHIAQETAKTLLKMYTNRGKTADWLDRRKGIYYYCW